jgi:hypothetical protein
MFNLVEDFTYMEEVKVTSKRKKEPEEVLQEEKPVKPLREKKPAKGVKEDEEPELHWWNDGRLSKITGLVLICGFYILSFYPC